MKSAADGREVHGGWGENYEIEILRLEEAEGKQVARNTRHDARHIQRPPHSPLSLSPVSTSAYTSRNQAAGSAGRANKSTKS